MEGLFAHLRQTRLYKFARDTWWIRTPLLTLWNAGFRCYFCLKRIVMRWQSFLGIVLWPFVGRGQEPPPTNPKLIAMLVFSDLAIDPRVEREGRALVAGGYRVVVIAPKFQAAEPPDSGAPASSSSSAQSKRLMRSTRSSGYSRFTCSERQSPSARSPITATMPGRS